MTREKQIEVCAQAAHEVNRVWCAAHGDMSQVHWEYAPEWQQESAIAGISEALAGATPEQQHDAWCRFKVREGWVYGVVKDPVAKTHPCLVPYAELPEHQRKKDEIYIATVRAMARAFGLIPAE